MTYAMPCPRCGLDIAGDELAVVADEVVAHASSEHRHQLDHATVIAHLEGRHPHG